MADDSLSSAWPTVRLGDDSCFKLIMGQSPPGSTYNESGNGLPFFQGKADFGKEHPIPRVFCTAPSRIAEASDVLISVRAPVGPTNLADSQCAIGRGLAAIRCLEGIAPRYLITVLRSAETEIAHLAEGQGGGFTCLRKEQLLAFEIPVPPLAEQQRIVGRIEALTSRLEEACQARQSAFAEAKELLVAAISKSLVERKAEMEPLCGLLIEQPRNGWSPPAVFQTGEGIPVLTLSAVTGFVYDGSRVKSTSAPTREGAHYWLKSGELLITRSNTPELVGHAAIYDGTPAKAICCDLIMKMTANPEKADIRFIHYCLRSPAVRQFVTHRAKGASGTMHKISKQDVQDIPIPRIPLPEQRRIVARLDALRAKVDELQRLQREVETELAAFTPALLAKAFRGEL